MYQEYFPKHFFSRTIPNLMKIKELLDENETKPKKEKLSNKDLLVEILPFLEEEEKCNLRFDVWYHLLFDTTMVEKLKHLIEKGNTTPMTFKKYVEKINSLTHHILYDYGCAKVNNEETNNRITDFFNKEDLPLIKKYFSTYEKKISIKGYELPSKNFGLDIRESLSCIFPYKFVDVIELDLDLDTRTISIYWFSPQAKMNCPQYKRDFTDEQYNLILDLLDEWYINASAYYHKEIERDRNLPQLNDEMKAEILKVANETIANLKNPKYKYKVEWEKGKLKYETERNYYEQLVVYYWGHCFDFGERWNYEKSIVFNTTRYGNGIVSMSSRTPLCGEWSYEFTMENLKGILENLD